MDFYKIKVLNMFYWLGCNIPPHRVTKFIIKKLYYFYLGRIYCIGRSFNWAVWDHGHAG